MVILLTAALALSSCVRIYYADPIMAWVVDATTGLPVEGVNVLAAWEANSGLEAGNITGYVKVMEDVTGANGEFSFPGWGPEVWFRGAIRDGAPLLILLKPGYEVSLVWEGKYGAKFAPSHLTSSWNGRSVSLKKYVTPEQEYSQLMSGLATTLALLIEQSDCAWRSAPKFLKKVDEQRRRFVSFPGERALLSIPSLEAMDRRANPVCGSLKDFVLERGQ